jgi:hypothetical protein
MMLIEPRGPQHFRRYTITLQGRTWDGRQWAKKTRKPLLFLTATEADAERQRLQPEVNKTSTVTLFTFPLLLHVNSAFPFDVDEMRKFLERQIDFSFVGMHGAPEGATCPFVNWGRCEIKQRGPWPDRTEARPVVLEVPLKIRLLTNSEIDLPKVTDWLKKHVVVTSDELIPACVPVALMQIGVAWKKAKVLNVPAK